MPHEHTRYSYGDKPNVALLTHLACRRIEEAPQKPQQPVEDELILFGISTNEVVTNLGPKKGESKIVFFVDGLPPLDAS